MTTTQPASGNDAALSERSTTRMVCDAQDHIADALNFAELIAMAHRYPKCPEDKALAAAALVITDALEAAKDLLRRVRGVELRTAADIADREGM